MNLNSKRIFWFSCSFLFYIREKNMLLYERRVIYMMLEALGYATVFALLAMVTAFISAKIESKITFKEIIDGFKRR